MKKVKYFEPINVYQGTIIVLGCVTPYYDKEKFFLILNDFDKGFKYTWKVNSSVIDIVNKCPIFIPFDSYLIWKSERELMLWDIKIVGDLDKAIDEFQSPFRSIDDLILSLQNDLLM